ncbi:Probable methylcrotonoyl-CoA carboxylase beta chain, mitochondrial [Chlamydiales bacterium SCGC AG-110-M15]|nr:Probable methylcrotonoyl-CoA carboxylase beta chain, mitochondrial [Chlamydiales bacterium SCGC AG-110-M15]
MTKTHDTEKEKKTLRSLTQEFAVLEDLIREGGGKRGQERQHKLGRLLARERIELLLDEGSKSFEMGLWAAYRMYKEWGDVPAAGTIAVLGKVCQREVLIIANDATVKAGAFFPQTVKKLIRAQRLAYACRLPIIYLVDSAGVFLPLQDEIFPDEDDFGRIFRNNSVLSAHGIPQIAAVMGNCIAGGGYLPVLCDKLLMTEGSGLYLAGPALVKAAIGQVVDAEDLGGASMHSEISGTVDFHEPDDESCIRRIRALVDMLPHDPESQASETRSKRPVEDVYDIVSVEGNKPYDMRDLLNCIVDINSFEEYKAKFGMTLVCGYAKIGGFPVGIVANQRQPTQSKKSGIEIGGVIYKESADKAARFVMDCNQSLVPIVFIQDVVGFMVGKTAEESGIIRSGAKLVSAMSNSIVPKLTVVVGNSFGAGNYALCGKAYDPTFITAWPNSKYSVMGADQAANTLFSVQKKAAEKRGKKMTEEELETMHQEINAAYLRHMDIRYGAARGWVDAIIQPHLTRDHLITQLRLVGRRKPEAGQFHTGVLQV